jgi:hypothetical protein
MKRTRSGQDRHPKRGEFEIPVSFAASPSQEFEIHKTELGS